MPFSIGWSELLVIGVIALIVIGPKDLPIVFRNTGRWLGKMRAMAREFQFAMDEAAEQSGLKDAKAQIEKATRLEGPGLDTLRDTVKGYQDDFNKINPLADSGEHADSQPQKRTDSKPQKKATHKPRKTKRKT